MSRTEAISPEAITKQEIGVKALEFSERLTTSLSKRPDFQQAVVEKYFSTKNGGLRASKPWDFEVTITEDGFDYKIGYTAFYTQSDFDSNIIHGKKVNLVLSKKVAGQSYWQDSNASILGLTVEFQGDEKTVREGSITFTQNPEDVLFSTESRKTSVNSPQAFEKAEEAFAALLK